MHELLLDRYGGMAGITEQGFGKLEGALAAPDVTMFGEDLYPDIASKAGILFWSLARAHALTDGNKRVALVALLDMLECEGLHLTATQDELFEFVIAAASDMPRDEVHDWIAGRLTAEPA